MTFDKDINFLTTSEITKFYLNTKEFWSTKQTIVCGSTSYGLYVTKT